MTCEGCAKSIKKAFEGVTGIITNFSFLDIDIDNI
jgi:copper chaperone CopZ